MQRAGAITGWLSVGIAAILSLAVAAEWARSYYFGQIVQHITRWEGLNDEGIRIYHTRAIYIASSRGAIRVRYAATLSSFSFGFRPLPGPQTLPSTRPASFSGQVEPTTRPTVRRQRYRLPMTNGWYRDIPVTYSFGRDQTTRERLFGFESADYDWENSRLHANGWLLGFPHWALVLLLALYPCGKAIAHWRKRKQASKPPASSHF